jgi:hypothetical protein
MAHYYAEMRFTGMRPAALQQALLKCQLALLEDGVLDDVEIVIERAEESTHCDFQPIDPSPFLLYVKTPDKDLK